jgi:hypothetical protein
MGRAGGRRGSAETLTTAFAQQIVSNACGEILATTRRRESDSQRRSSSLHDPPNSIYRMNKIGSGMPITHSMAQKKRLPIVTAPGSSVSLGLARSSARMPVDRGSNRHAESNVTAVLALNRRDFIDLLNGH